MRQVESDGTPTTPATTLLSLCHLALRPSHFSDKKEVKDSRLLSKGIFTFLKGSSVGRAMLNRGENCQWWTSGKGILGRSRTQILSPRDVFRGKTILGRKEGWRGLNIEHKSVYFCSEL